MNKPVYLRKILMYEFWYDYVKRKYSKKAKPCFMDTGIFIAHAKTDDICKDIAEDFERILGNSNFEIDRPLPKGNWDN